MPYGVNPQTGKPGPAPYPRRDGDRHQARRFVNLQVRNGERPTAKALPCVDCGHVWKRGGRKHEYDHHKGYAADHHGDVEPVCLPCHRRREMARRTECKSGHPNTLENRIANGVGQWRCRECSRIRDRVRRDATYWREYRRKRNG